MDSGIELVRDDVKRNSRVKRNILVTCGTAVVKRLVANSIHGQGRDVGSGDFRFMVWINQSGTTRNDLRIEAEEPSIPLNANLDKFQGAEWNHDESTSDEVQNVNNRWLIIPGKTELSELNCGSRNLREPTQRKVHV